MKLQRKWGRLLALLLAFAMLAAACSEAEDAVDDVVEEVTDGEDEMSEDEMSEDMASYGGDVNGDGILQVAIMGECEGPFGGFHEAVVGGATLPLIRYAGATSNNAESALDGFSGAEVAGTAIEFVGVGCGDDTGPRALEEIRQLVEQDGAEVVLGPLSGDESVVISDYALGNPDVIVINGTAGAQSSTLKTGAENYFRFNGDGAQWNAGIGEILAGEWETAAVIADDYSFGHTSAAGFIAEFCAAGGDVISRVFPPLNGADYGAFIAQLPDPDEVDGYFWAVGGDTVAALQAFENAKGDLSGAQHAGNLFFGPGLSASISGDLDGAYFGGFTTPNIGNEEGI